MRNILLTNDDGIEADGLRSLRRALAQLDEVRVVVIAPDGNRSAMARSITTRRPLWVAEVRVRRRHVGYATDGTPVDCVRLANLGLIEDFEPDLVVSGINHGANLGDDITYSGTVAAALEGSSSASPAIAVSQQSGRAEGDWTATAPSTFSIAADFVARLVESLRDSPLPPATLLNVNVPGVRSRRRRGDAPGKRVYRDELRLETEEEGRRRYWIYGTAPGYEDEPGTDLAAVARGRIALTPLHFDLTDRPGIAALQRLDLGRLLGMSNAADPAARAAELRTQARLSLAALLRRGRPRDRGRRVRRALPRARRDRDRAPRAGRRGLADPASRRRGGRPAGEGGASAADALAGERPLRGGAARMGGSDALAPRTRGDREAGVQVRLRAEDRRPGRVADYRDGRFEQGATRGNGEIGEDVTHNLRTIASLPPPIEDAPPLIEVRGEVYMSLPDFATLNERYAAEGRSTFMNPRNTAAGTIRQLDPALAAARPLSLLAYAWASSRDSS